MTSTAAHAAPDRDVFLPPFLLSIDLDGGRISLHGELDRPHVDRLLESVAALAHSTAPRWTIDLAGITFCDTAGLRGLLAVQRLAEDTGRPLSVVRCSRWMRQLLVMAGLSSLVEQGPRGSSA
jgi:anti-sigma B factor antagonist